MIPDDPMFAEVDRIGGNITVCAPGLYNRNMVDHFPMGSRGNTSYHGGVGNGYYSMWYKPRRCTLVMAWVVGGGGGGGGGRTGATSTNRGGGGGGAAGCHARVIIPAICLPDTLRLYCAEAGGGGAANAAGTAGGITYIAANSSFSSNADYLLKANGGNGGAAGSNAGANAAGGTVGAGGAGAGQDNWIASSGVYYPVPGTAGATGGSTGAGTNIAFGSNNNTFTSGAGGGASGVGNNDAAGGAVTALLPHPGLAGGAAGGGDGLRGITTWGLKDISCGALGNLWSVLMACGGTGGGSSGAGTGGRGGDGGQFGCGGGGGGGGITGGRGGDGAPGAIIIVAM